MTRKTAPTDSKSRWRDAPPDRSGHALHPGDEPCQLPQIESPPVVGETAGASPSNSGQQDAIEVNREELPASTPRGLIARLGSLRTSSWLASAVIHLLLLIILALLTYRLGGTERGIAIEGAWSDGSPAVEFETVTASQADSKDNADSDQPVSVEVPTAIASMAAPNSIAPNQATPVDQSAMAELKTGGGPSAAKSNAYLGGGGMSARTPEGRKKYGDRFGATKESEMAVENALRWLATHQRNDGSWSFDLRLAPCEGRCSNGKKVGEDTPTPATAATGLALLAFHGAGYTSEVGPYQEVVSRGIYYLRNVAAETEHGYDWQQSGSMYGHGIALMAISEALGMTRHDGRYDTDLLHYAEQGTRFTVTAQHESGSWGYTPGSPGDTTLTGWQVLSLIGAKKAGIQTRSDTFSRAKKFLLSVREEPSYQFGYRTPEAEPTTTAIALTLMMYLGQTPGYTYFDRAVDQLAENGPTLTNVYHDYYATMALHHFRHRDWESWNAKLRDHLVRTQATKGHEAGSWHFRDKWGDVGGRVYTTAMCTLMLEVYYRFLPLYDEPPEFPL